MNNTRNITYKYKDFNYSTEVKELLLVSLTPTDRKKLNKIYNNYYALNVQRGYEYIIEDIYKLVEKQKLTTEQIALVYQVGIRTIQIWLKELGLNRTTENSKKIAQKPKAIDLNMDNPNSSKEFSGSSDLAEKFGIKTFEESPMPEALIDFLNYLETIKGKSINTIEGYKIDLCLFFRFLKVYKGMVFDSNLEFSEIPIGDIDKDFITKIKLTDLYAFLSFAEKQRNNGTYARARKVATLKSFFKFLHGKAKIIPENPTLELESPKINKRHPVYLTLDESLKLLSSLDKNNINYYRDFCILTLFLNCGMRLSELCGIRIDKIKGDTLTIIGKGNKERTVYLNDACLNAIENYKKVRNDSKAIGDNKKYLLLSSHSKPISKRTVELLVKKHIQNAGMQESRKYTPHKLRHTAATLMFKHGNVDIRSLQNILGHENISTTQIYTHVDDETLRDAVKSNPLAYIHKD